MTLNLRRGMPCVRSFKLIHRILLPHEPAMEILYNLINLVVMPFWLLMIFLPRQDFTLRLMRRLWPFAIVPVVYAGLLVIGLSSMEAAPLDFTLNGIAGLLGTPAGALVAWAHFLALDLFTGRWVYLDSRDREMSPWLASPAVFFCLMAGPLGLLLYILLRTFLKGRAAS